MDEITQQVIAVAGVLLTCFSGPILAVFFLSYRKRRARAQRRSPIGIAMLRSPGHTLREQLEEARGDLLSQIFSLMVIPLMALALSLAQGHFLGMERMVRSVPIYIVLVGLFVGFMVYRLWRAGESLDNLKAGFDAELAVGQALDQLMRQGAVVFHDVPADNFNIDHVVISRSGVFAVETKGYTKRGKGKASATVEFDGERLKFPSWTTKAPLEQAERQAAWLSKWLTKAVGATTQVLPVLALPGWYVERIGRGDVRVFSGGELPSLLRMRCGDHLPDQTVQQIAHQIDQRCRTVAPRYSEQEAAA